MTANPLKQVFPDAERLHPPKDAEQRVRFWIERGNIMLLEEGRDDLEWVHSNGHYSIQRRVSRSGIPHTRGA